MDVPMTGIPEFLNSEPINVEANDDGSFYIPIWQVESDLNNLCENNWSRHNHKYSFHVDHNGDLWLATSVITEVHYGELKRLLVCSSYLRAIDYPDSKNILQTGIAEATKAGVKVLGNRFGYALNERTVLKPVKKKEPVKSRPDATVMKAYLKAVTEKDEEKIKQLLSRYNIKTEQQ